MKQIPLLLSLLIATGLADASCGSSYCSVNTNWDTQGLASNSGWQADLRYSYAKADRLMAGSSRISPAAPSGSDEEIENRRTINQLANLNLDYAINSRWDVSLGLPLVMRDHSHTFDSSAGAFEQQARFSELGDIRVLGKFNVDLGSHSAGAGLRFGLKLPTGATDKTMSPPDPADPTTPYKLERSAQPGSGSTDGILGAHYFRNSPDNSSGWFVSAQIQSALSTTDNYRPGRELSIDLGTHYEVAPALNLLLQLNGQQRARDSGANANAASGGYALNLSPGASYALTPQLQVYGYLQLPIVVHMNTDSADANSGQLVARWSAALGITQRF